MIALVLAMVWSRRGQAVTLALLTMFGVAAAVAAPAYLRAADRAVAAGQVATADARSRSLTLTARQHDPRPGRSDPAALKADIPLTETGSTLAGMPGFDYTYAAEYPTLGLERTDKVRTRFVYRQDVCAHLVVVAGRCLIGESDLVIGEQTARRAQLAPGDEIALTWAYYNADPAVAAFIPDGTAKRFLITGVYRASDPGDAYWGTHNYFGADTGGRAGEPVFVTNASLTGMDHGGVELGLDGSAPPGALTVDRLDAVRSALAGLVARTTALGPGIELDTSIPGLLGRIDAGRSAAHRIVPVLAVCLVLLACLTIFLAVGYGTEGRRPELAVVALRGARWGQRWWLATGENLVGILAGTVLGCVAGQLLVDAFAAWRFPGVGADPGLDSLRWAPVATAAAVLTALLAQRRQIATPVAELLRRAPLVPGHALAVALDLVVAALAVVAAVQLTASGGDLRGAGAWATALVLLAGALLVARLLLPWATLISRRALRRGRLGPALAGFQLFRRPGAVRLFALVTASVAVTGYAACAVDVGLRGRAEQAVLGTGAARVLSVGPVSRQGLLDAVRATDPSGAYAMAAVRLPGGIALDSTRLAAAAAWPGGGPSARTVAAALHPSDPVPVRVPTDQVVFDITARGFTLGKQVTVTAVLSPAGGTADELLPLGVLREGRHTYGRKVPVCARGCQLNSLRVAGGEGSIDVAGHIVVHSLTGVRLDAGGWRTTPGGTVATAPDGLRIDVTSLNGLAAGMFVEPADTPFPLPVATAGQDAITTVVGLDAADIPVTQAARLTVVPGIGAPATIVDLDYADRVSTDGAQSNTAQVWLGPNAPADAPARLTAHGLQITADNPAALVRERLDIGGPSLALWFYAIVAVLATLLAAGALILATTVDRARRVEDLTALRTQGLSRADLRTATLGTYPALVTVASLAGIGTALLGWRVTGWALPLAGLDPPPFPLPGWPRPAVVILTGLAVFAVLALVAFLTGRRTLRSIP